jgi:uncharacterized protein
MSLDITPAIYAGGQLVQRYGEGGFRVSGEDYSGSVIVLDEQTVLWDVTSVDQITMENLLPVFEVEPRPVILLIGCGAKFTPPPKDLRLALKEKGIALEWMDTGAASRTYNVLLAEGRPSAAALIAID